MVKIYNFDFKDFFFFFLSILFYLVFFFDFFFFVKNILEIFLGNLIYYFLKKWIFKF